MPFFKLYNFGRWHRHGWVIPRHVHPKWVAHLNLPAISILILLGINLAADGQTKPETEKIAAAKAERQKFIKEKHPLRVIGDQLYDFTPLIATSDDKTYSHWVVRGKVLNVLKDGLLLTTDIGIVHLRNYRNQESVVDGSSVLTAAVVIGRYQYTAVTGGVITTPDYDCGHFWDPKEEKFRKKQLLKPWETTTLEVAVWEIDMP